jgi:hypothetical protein
MSYSNTLGDWDEEHHDGGPISNVHVGGPSDRGEAVTRKRDPGWIGFSRAAWE